MMDSKRSGVTALRETCIRPPGGRATFFIFWFELFIDS